MTGSDGPVKALLALLLAAAVATSGAACGGGSRTKNTGRLTVGTMKDARPFEFEKSGRMTGFDVELAAALAKRMGLRLEIVTDPWNSLTANLEAGKYDMVMAATTITFERRRALDFSDPYFETDQAISVMRTSSIRSGGDLSGKTVGVLNSSTPQYAAEKIPGLRAIVKYDAVPDVFEALQNGRVDATIMDCSIAERYARETGNQRVIATIVTEEEYGIV